MDEVMFRVKFVVFHPDNHQGGSGTWMEHETFIPISSNVNLGAAETNISMKMESEVRAMTNGWGDAVHFIKSYEVVSW